MGRDRRRHDPHVNGRNELHPSGERLESGAVEHGLDRLALNTAARGGGSRRPILASEDSGQTWQAAPVPQKNTLFSVAAGPTGRVAVGGDGTIIKSSDGLRWVIAKSVSTQTLRAVSGDQRRYFAVGASGTVITSTDCGSSWTLAP